jgi:hypothetical protein
VSTECELKSIDKSAIPNGNGNNEERDFGGNLAFRNGFIINGSKFIDYCDVCHGNHLSEIIILVSFHFLTLP